MAPGRNGRRQRRPLTHYTVDDLAGRTGLTPRTIRSYQTQGLLPPPDRHGRVAYYDDSHLDRLEEIGELKEDGLSLASIQDVLTRREVETRAKASRARARAKANPPSGSPAPTPAGSRPVTASAPLMLTGAAKPVDVGTGTTRVPMLDIDPEAKTKDKDSEPPKRRLSLVASVVLAVLLTVAAVSSVIAVLRLSDAADDRKRLGRQVSDLQSDLSRLDGNQGPPATVVVPGPIQQAPAPAAPHATAPPSTRTVVVTPRQAPATPPATNPPASPPTTQPCALPVAGLCLG